VGLLDELEQEIQQRQLGNLDVERLKVDREELFRTITAPRIDALYDYLKKLVTHLRILKPEKAAYFTLQVYGEITTQILHDYDLQLTTQPSSKEIHLSFPCMIVSKQCPLLEVQGASQIKAINNLFQRYQIGGLLTSEKDAAGKLIQAVFQAKGRIVLGAVFSADVSSGMVKTTFTNFGRLNTVTKNIHPAQLTEDLFDKIGRYLLRDSDDLFRETLSDAYRKQLQTKIQKEMIKRKWESQILAQRDNKWMNGKEKSAKSHSAETTEQIEERSHQHWAGNLLNKWRENKK